MQRLPLRRCCLVGKSDRKREKIQKLREKGCRITRQRLMLLDIILKEECSCCKEIYYKASREDDRIGPETVYRMVNILEEIGAVSRKNMYKIACGHIENQEIRKVTVKPCDCE